MQALAKIATPNLSVLDKVTQFTSNLVGKAHGRKCSRRCFVPPHIEKKLKTHFEKTKETNAEMYQQMHAHAAHSSAFRWNRASWWWNHDKEVDKKKPQTQPQVNVSIYDAATSERLPGKQVEKNQDKSKDISCHEAYTSSIATYNLYKQIFNRNSIDNKGLELRSTVHFGKKYDNAFWNGAQMVYGDGDGTIFTRFTESVDITGHEMTHGVTQYTTNLEYQGQSGALNESISDVFGSMVKQFLLHQSTSQADWLIGQGILIGYPQMALRSMKAPGTAYVNHPILGTDEQPSTMADYKNMEDDEGGVHINSGIPNHAFYLVASKIGGNSWDKPGAIWYRTITTPNLVKSNANFSNFAWATIASAAALYGKDSAEQKAVVDAWNEVGVTPVSSLA